MQYDAFADWVRQTSFAGLPLWNLMLALAAAVASYAVIGLLLRLLTGRAKTWASLTDGAVARTGVDVLEGTSRPLMLVLALLIGASLLDLPRRCENPLNQLWFVAMALQLGLWGRRAIDLGVHRYLERHGPANAATGTAQQVGASATLLSWGLRSLLGSVVVLAILSNVGVNVTAFIASLGGGGIAAAFEVGDFITVGSISGTVQVIGLKTTRIRSLQGEQIVVSNTDLLKQTISNFRLLETRRIVFGFGVAYGTTPEQAQAIPGLVRRLIEAQPKLRFARARFNAFGPRSVDSQVVYFVEYPAYGVYMDLQQSINLGLMRELQALGVEFALPTRTLHIASAPAQGPGSEPLAAS